MLLNSTKPPKSKHLSLHQLKELVEEEKNFKPVELASSDTNRKVEERRKREAQIEQIYKQVCTDVAAKINPTRGAFLNPLNNG